MLSTVGRAVLRSATVGRQTATVTATVAAGVPVLSRGYHDKVIDHYERPRNVGKLDPADPNVGTGLVGAPACGDVMKLQIRVDEETGKIVESKFKTFGCGSAIAASSLTTEWIRGMSLDEAENVSNREIAKELKLPPVKLHCSMLAQDAIRKAVQDLEGKRAAREAAAAN